MKLKWRYYFKYGEFILNCAIFNQIVIDQEFDFSYINHKPDLLIRNLTQPINHEALIMNMFIVYQ
jgi:hypothetical protein